MTAVLPSDCGAVRGISEKPEVRFAPKRRPDDSYARVFPLDSGDFGNQDSAGREKQ